jgi:hypothetical protein
VRWSVGVQSGDDSGHVPERAAVLAVLRYAGAVRGESFLRVHWVAVPKAVRARRVNQGQPLGSVDPSGQVRSSCCLPACLPRELPAACRSDRLTG